ncbi:Dehydrogenase/reductase SDR family member 1-like [Aphelenchoides fujianensis]|nr:Dehydrogenase/reductase SDR family member 1-like [Aphelenchoides fujianensis]
MQRAGLVFFIVFRQLFLFQFRLVLLFNAPLVLRFQLVLQFLFLFTELFKEHVGEKPLFAGAESIYFAGRCLVKAAADREFLKQQNGKVLLTSDLSARYDIKDINGELVKHESQARLRPLYEAMDKIHTRDLHPDA